MDKILDFRRTSGASDPAYFPPTLIKVVVPTDDFDTISEMMDYTLNFTSFSAWSLSEFGKANLGWDEPKCHYTVTFNNEADRMMFKIKYGY